MSKGFVQKKTRHDSHGTHVDLVGCQPTKNPMATASVVHQGVDAEDVPSVRIHHEDGKV